MNESRNWKKIYEEITQSDDHIVGKINYYNLTSILEDLHLENARLRDRIAKLENKILENDLNFEGCYD